MLLELAGAVVIPVRLEHEELPREIGHRTRHHFEIHAELPGLFVVLKRAALYEVVELHQTAALASSNAEYRSPSAWLTVTPSLPVT